ncbi:hypothetical protein Q5424_08870 [Conexibacter sp. JD483]|uniref:hypothetical protein n=1 Tax=unclassified Conexibacter TaxID=2627773 RepID=UPI00272752C1|nr:MULTISPECIES: hypothetical protein [unclassified Conexibacter]MDO8186391.1 hypothetical protein [Conexibacter sp. CPCC 205706]MDO8199790.1 hypothetical protein [Conexibacter sp. CPCC 205762]MDR9369190.1 hypothetical protein [Conexibacter sp. JD483]
MATSQAWGDFIVNLREAVQLLVANPSSPTMQRSMPKPDRRRGGHSGALSMAMTKGCVMLVSGRLQGCLESQAQEFLERIDQSGTATRKLPEVLRAELCERYMDRRKAKPEQLAEMHRRYAVLWIEEASLPAGTLRTDSLPDRVWNPWPEKAQALLRRCDINLFERIETKHGSRYLRDLKEYGGELVTYRNDVAHGGEPALWTVTDVLLRIRWAQRLARHCDAALGDKLEAVTGRGW